MILEGIIVWCIVLMLMALTLFSVKKSLEYMYDIKILIKKFKKKDLSKS